MRINPLTSAALAGAVTLCASAVHAETQSENIAPQETAVFNWTADESGDVIISIDGEGDSNLDLSIYDAEGELLASDTSDDDNEQVRLSVTEGQAYEIRVENLGRVSNACDLELSYVNESVADTVDANDRVTYDYRVPRGVRGQIVVTLHGNSGTDLDLRIYDSRGRPLEQSLSLDDHERLVLNAEAGREYQIEVANLGDVRAEFTLDIQE